MCVWIFDDLVSLIPQALFITLNVKTWLVYFCDGPVMAVKTGPLQWGAVGDLIQKPLTHIHMKLKSFTYSAENLSHTL